MISNDELQGLIDLMLNTSGQLAVYCNDADLVAPNVRVFVKHSPKDIVELAGEVIEARKLILDAEIAIEADQLYLSHTRDRVMDCETEIKSLKHALHRIVDFSKWKNNLPGLVDCINYLQSIAEEALRGGKND